jgi:hypothetical protein
MHLAEWIPQTMNSSIGSYWMPILRFLILLWSVIYFRLTWLAPDFWVSCWWRSVSFNEVVILFPGIIAWLQGRLWVIVWSPKCQASKNILPMALCRKTSRILGADESVHCPSNALSFEYQQENPFVVLFTDEKPQHCTAATRTPSFPPRSMPEWKPNRFSSPTVQIKVRGGLCEFSGSWGIRLEDYLPACVMEAKSCPVAPCSWVWPWSAATLQAYAPEPRSPNTHHMKPIHNHQQERIKLWCRHWLGGALLLREGFRGAEFAEMK